MDHTAFNLQRTPCQPLPRKRSPDGASTECGGEHIIAAHYSFIDAERMKGWVTNENSLFWSHDSWIWYQNTHIQNWYQKNLVPDCMKKLVPVSWVSYCCYGVEFVKVFSVFGVMEFCLSKDCVFTFAVESVTISWVVYVTLCYWMWISLALTASIVMPSRSGQRVHWPLNYQLLYCIQGTGGS